MFTKEHYIAVAKVLRTYEMCVGATYNLPLVNIRSSIILDFAELFKGDNSEFDKAKFLDAIYGKEVSKSEEK